MSAVFGVFGAFRRSEINEMGRRLAHRGTNCSLSFVADNLVLGSVSAAPNECVSLSDDVSLVCDAHIFNKTSLVERLRQHGVRDKLQGTGDVLAALHQHLGPEAIEAVDGNFAFVLVNSRSNQIVLGRDYFGCAPLYYTVLRSGGVAFASEYKALLCLSEVMPEVDRDMLQYLQHTKKLPVGRTLFGNVHSALPGRVMALDYRGTPLRSYAYAPLEVGEQILSEGDAVGKICSELVNSIRRKSDDLNPIGVSLSGGIDSIGVAILLRNIYPDREIHTFTAGHGPRDPEVRTAAAVAKEMGSIHHEVITPAWILRETLRTVVWHIESPIAGSEVPQLFEIGRAAKGHVTALFSGQGADSLFAGMPRYKILWLMKLLPMFRVALAEFYNFTQTGLKPESLTGRALNWAYFRGHFPDVPQINGAVWKPEPLRLPAIGRQFINEVMAHSFQAGQCQDTVKFERCFGASGLLYSSPFSDMRFARLAYRVGDNLKIRGGVEKYILRKALDEIVPERFRRIPKFPQRMRCDVRFSETLDQIASSLFTRNAVGRRGFYGFDTIELVRHRARERPYQYGRAMRLWTMILTELWAQEFLDKRGRGT